MKYETLVKIHHNAWSASMFTGNWDRFEPKKEYTIFDLLSYIPGNLAFYFSNGVEWLWEHRKKWIIAKATNSKKPTEKK